LFSPETSTVSSAPASSHAMTPPDRIADASAAEQIVAQARERGLLLLLAGGGNVIRILVPLVIDARDLDEALARLTAACEAVLVR